MKQVFHKKARTGKTRVWTIEVDGKFVHTTFGELNGAMQKVTDEGKVKNMGRSNEVSAEEDAQALANRQVLLKTRGGYRPQGQEVESELRFDRPLPQELCFYKPDNTLSVRMQKLVTSGDAWLGRKRDGEMMVFVKNSRGEVDIYSRRMLQNHHLEDETHPWTERFSHLVEELEERDDVPNGTIFLGDVVSDPKDDSRWDVAAVMKTKTPESIRRQQVTPLFFYCWDIAAWDGEEILTDMAIKDRFELLWSVFGREWDGESWFLPVEVWEPARVLRSCSKLASRDEAVPATNLDAAGFFAKKKGWEGWVAVDPEGIFGDRAFNFRGKPDRPGKYSGKIKPVYEDDFIAKFDPDGEGHGKWGRGKHRGQVGAVSLFQYDTKGDLVYICECGGGIDDAFRLKYSSPAIYPLCIRVLYTDRTYKKQDDKTNALTYPRVDEVRADKNIDECINGKL